MQYHKSSCRRSTHAWCKAAVKRLHLHEVSSQTLLLSSISSNFHPSASLSCLSPFPSSTLFMFFHGIGQIWVGFSDSNTQANVAGPSETTRPAPGQHIQWICCKRFFLIIFFFYIEKNNTSSSEQLSHWPKCPPHPCSCTQEKIVNQRPVPRPGNLTPRVPTCNVMKCLKTKSKRAGGSSSLLLWILVCRCTQVGGYFNFHQNKKSQVSYPCGSGSKFKITSQIILSSISCW